MTKQETKHTPGPWQAYNRVGNRIFNQWRVYSDCLNQPCAICKMDESLTGDQEVANARLIAAAPDLLEALRALTDWGCEHTSPRDNNSPHALLIAARAAVAKAEGK